ncbi:MAG: hypothetical protein LBC42_01510 [Puniceicoccales bacterium]|nr:hypothetical protein [Puniceicoccales bacterium]
MESRCTDVSGVFVQGSIGREFDRREEVHQRTTTFRSGAIGREWVYDSPQARTHYGVAVSYTKSRPSIRWSVGGLGEQQR